MREGTCDEELRLEKFEKGTREGDEITYLIPRQILLPLEKGTKYLSSLCSLTTSPAADTSVEVVSQRVGSNFSGEGKILGE